MYHLQNPVNGLAPFRVLVAQSVEHPPGVRKVMGSNPIGDSYFFSEFIYLCFNYSFKHKQTTYSNCCNTCTCNTIVLYTYHLLVVYLSSTPRLLAPAAAHPCVQNTVRYPVPDK